MGTNFMPVEFMMRDEWGNWNSREQVQEWNTGTEVEMEHWNGNRSGTGAREWDLAKIGVNRILH